MFAVLAALGASLGSQPILGPQAGIPPRPADAPGGAAFMAHLAKMSPTDREDVIAAELVRGNVPDFLRTMVLVTVTANAHTITYRVMPDYLAVGTDADFVRVPMRPTTAQRVADAFGCALTTRKMCDDIYRQAAVKLEPRPLVIRRDAVETFVQHNAIVEAQLGGLPRGVLVAGHKKDVVVTNRLNEKPNRVAIYGWHKLNGVAIQPLSIAHTLPHVDYSHGVRFVHRAVIVDGKLRDLRDVAAAPDLYPLVSDEGPLVRPMY